MKSEFKVKFLQNLVSKKKNNEGFTLIELLVVIIIVGVLAAIALPSFLNQIGKARGSEAKSNLGTMNRSQQSYRLENNTFASTLTNLDARISGKFYGYAVTGGNATGVGATTTPTNGTTDGLKVSSAYATQSGDVFSQAICESNDTSGTVSATMTSTTCPANYRNIN
ncbi:MAG TPA: type IV pilin-like G/H family protein [Stenomitos sp.]